MTDNISPYPHPETEQTDLTVLDIAWKKIEDYCKSVIKEVEEEKALSLSENS